MLDKIAEKPLGAAKDYGFSVGIILVIVGAVVFTFLPDEIVNRGLGIAWTYLPLWLTIVFAFVFYDKWMGYVQTKAFFSLEKVLLEIKLPEEITQSPFAMETVFNSFYYTGEPEHAYDRYIKGKTRPQFSLEIVSFEGNVRFFIQTREKNRNVIEAQLYSHYPTIEIYEVPDYMPRFPYDESKVKIWGVYQKLQKPDPYPIKTYVDYRLDAEQKEEFKVDPISGILEFFGSMGEGEFAFLQIIIRSHQAEKKKPGTWFQTEDWKAEAEREKEDIIAKIRDNGDDSVPRSFTEGERRTIEALERNTSKKPFDVGMRLMYMSDNDHYRSERHAGFPTMLRSFENEGSNGFKPIFLGFTYPWEDPFGWRQKALLRELYEGYRTRSVLTPPYNDHTRFVLSTEELATVYHFPGRVTQVPTIERLTSRKEEAPPNLPYQ